MDIIAKCRYYCYIRFMFCNIYLLILIFIYVHIEIKKNICLCIKIYYIVLYINYLYKFIVSNT